MSACCDSANVTKTATWWRHCREFGAWAFPSAILALMPKCPVCLAAYVAVWTGLGLSLSTAIYLRMALFVLCFASLLYLILTRVGRFVVAKKAKRQSIVPRADTAETKP
jgi:hypothetical protein